MGEQYIPNQVFLCNRKYDSFVVRSSQRGGKFINAVQYLISKRVGSCRHERYGARGRDPDNLCAGVTKVCRNEPELNPTCADLAQDYGLAVISALLQSGRTQRRAGRAPRRLESPSLQAAPRMSAVRLRDRGPAGAPTAPD